MAVYSKVAIGRRSPKSVVNTWQAAFGDENIAPPFHLYWLPMFEQAIDPRFQIWDLAIKTGTGLLAVVGGLIAAKKYLDDKKFADNQASENATKAIAAAKADYVKAFLSQAAGDLFRLVRNYCIHL